MEIGKPGISPGTNPLCGFTSTPPTGLASGSLNAPNLALMLRPWVTAEDYRVCPQGSKTSAAGLGRKDIC